MSTPHLKTKIYTSFKEIPQQDWDSVVKESNIYLSEGYLISLEQGLSETIDFYYTISYNTEAEPAQREP